MQLCAVMAERPERASAWALTPAPRCSDTFQTGDRQEDDAQLAVLLDHVCEHRKRAEFQHHLHNHLTEDRPGHTHQRTSGTF